MRHAFLTLALAATLWMTPAQAEDSLGYSLRDLFTEMEKMAEDVLPLMQSWLDQLRPQLEALGDQVEDWSRYEAPEVLPNGDIIIRKKLGPPEDGQVDL